jgi:hypothetical protein
MLSNEGTMSGTTGTLRLISQDLLDDLEAAFRRPDIQAASTEADIKWAAAQFAVVEWVKAKAGAKQTVGRPNQEPGRPMPTGAIVRIGQ